MCESVEVHSPTPLLYINPAQVKLPANALPIKQAPSTKLLHPPIVDGVKLMSYGFVAPGTATGEATTSAGRCTQGV